MSLETSVKELAEAVGADVKALDTSLETKVDKVTGKGLSDTNFTQAEKDKLSALEGSKFVGLFVNESALPSTGGEGDYANVDGGVGSDVYRVIWNSNDNKWVRAQGVSTDLTPAQIKQQYESNPDTNAFTDEERAKLSGVASEATKNRADSQNADKVHAHTISDVTGLTKRLNDIDALVSAGDAALRQELANPDKGAAIVGWKRNTLSDNITSAGQMLDAQDVSIWEFAHLVIDRPNPDDPETWDWYPALQAAIDSQSYAGPGVYRGGPAVKLTPGKFKCSQTLIFSTAAKLYSYHSGMPYSQTSEIEFPENVLGIAINDKASRGVTAISPTGTSAAGAWLEGMKISGGGGTSADAHGVLCRVRAVLNNLWVTGFAANGVRVSSTYPGTANSNANNGNIIGGRYELNGLHGLYFTGSDANIWGVSGLDCSLNGCSGIFDSSFLGCTFTACHTANNGRRSMCHYDGGRYAVLSDTLGGSTVPGTNPAVWELINTGGPAGAFGEWESGKEYLIGASYRSDAAAAKSTFIGCYAEGSQPLSSIGQSSIVVGGVLGSSPFSSTSNGSVVSSFFGGLSATNGYVSGKKTDDLRFSMGEFEGATKTLLKITDTVLAPSSYRLRFLNDDIVFNYANGANYNSSIAFWLTTIATKRTFGRASPVPHALASNRLFIGNANGSRNITSVGALPVSGEYARGDILFHSGLSAGGKAGWVCTTTGVAGSTAVFKPFGAIDA